VSPADSFSDEVLEPEHTPLLEIEGTGVCGVAVGIVDVTSALLNIGGGFITILYVRGNPTAQLLNPFLIW
jgi:hypothetical protein